MFKSTVRPHLCDNISPKMQKTSKKKMGLNGNAEGLKPL